MAAAEMAAAAAGTDPAAWRLDGVSTIDDLDLPPDAVETPDP
jgi:hypothetical protein